MINIFNLKIFWFVVNTYVLISAMFLASWILLNTVRLTLSRTTIGNIKSKYPSLSDFIIKNKLLTGWFVAFTFIFISGYTGNTLKVVFLIFSFIQSYLIYKYFGDTTNTK